MPFPDISNRPYQLSLIPSANHSMLNYATVGFLGLQTIGLVLFLLEKGLQDDVLVNIATACDGKELSLTAA